MKKSKKKGKMDQATIERLGKIDDVIAQYEERYENSHKVLIELLQEILETFNYVPEEALVRISEKCDVPLSKLFSLATFYNSLRLEPLGKHHICVCVGTTCHVNGASDIVDNLQRKLNVEPGHTTADGNFTVETVNCLGVCARGPLVEIDGKYHGNMTPIKVNKLLEKYENGKSDRDS
ncbi:MAG: NADH-quinone oxidoreductase subunit NuoE [Candidatus Poribacteria bacterium]|mgnify:CR=1 FL=1